MSRFFPDWIIVLEDNSHFRCGISGLFHFVGQVSWNGSITSALIDSLLLIL